MKRTKIKMWKRVRKRAEFRSLSKEGLQEAILYQIQKRKLKKEKVQQQELETQCHRRESEAAKSEGLHTWRAEGGKGRSSNAARQGRNEEPQEKTTFHRFAEKHEFTELGVNDWKK